MKSKLFLAPMAGVTNVAFRELCKKYGAGLTYTEFVSSEGLVRLNKKTLSMVRVESKGPVAVQIFGSDPKKMVKAAKLLESKFDYIDVNLGCPVPKVVKQLAGSALLEHPEKVREIVSALVKNLSKPVTVKIRLDNSVEIAKICEECGAKMIAVHGRTVEQGYRGKVN